MPDALDQLPPRSVVITVILTLVIKVEVYNEALHVGNYIIVLPDYRLSFPDFHAYSHLYYSFDLQPSKVYLYTY